MTLLSGLYGASKNNRVTKVGFADKIILTLKNFNFNNISYPKRSTRYIG